MDYSATVKDENQTVNTYTGLARNTFKQIYNGYKHRDQTSTTISTRLCKLRNEAKNYEISWNIIDHAQDFNPITRK